MKYLVVYFMFRKKTRSTKTKNKGEGETSKDRSKDRECCCKEISVAGVQDIRTESSVGLEKVTSEVEKVRKVLRKRGQKNDWSTLQKEPHINLIKRVPKGVVNRVPNGVSKGKRVPNWVPNRREKESQNKAPCTPSVEEKESPNESRKESPAKSPPESRNKSPTASVAGVDNVERDRMWIDN